MALSLKKLAEKMRDIDTCMLGTHTAGGTMGARPMSNNREVSYDGTAYYFTWKNSRMARDIGRDNTVLVTYQGAKGMWVAVQGRATVSTDKALMLEHWDPEVERWFEQGVETPGLAMLVVKATRINYWTFEDGDGEITPGARAR